MTRYLAMDIDGYQPGTTKSDDAQENGVVQKHAQVNQNLVQREASHERFNILLCIALVTTYCFLLTKALSKTVL